MPVSPSPSIDPAAPEGPPFATREAVLRWLEHHDLTHLAYVSLEVVAPLLEANHWPLLRAAGAKRYLTDLAAAQTCARVLPLFPAPLRASVPAAVVRFLEAQRDCVARARDEVPARLAAPVPAEVAPLHARLLSLRERFPTSTAPRLDTALDASRLKFDASNVQWVFKDTWPSRVLGSSQRFAAPTITLTLEGPTMVSGCTCGAAFCEHALAAIDAALVWLRDPPPRVESALASLTQPAWMHALATLDRVLVSDPLERSGARVEWRVAIDGDRIGVTPWIAKRGKGARLGVARPTTGSQLRSALGSKLEPADARVAALSETGLSATSAVLEALVGHPCVVRDDAPERSLQIARASLGLLAEDRHGSMCVTAALEGGAPLSPELLERVERSVPGELVFVDEGPRLTLIDVSAELRAVLPILRRQGYLFPPESRTALLASLSRWAERIPIAMPQSVMGIAIPPQTRAVLRLQAHSNGAIHLEVRVRPLPEAPSFEPGRGMEVVYIRREGRPHHARRDFDGEIGLARDVLARCGLASGEALEHAWSRRLTDGREALAILALAERLDPAPELEWEGRPIRALPAPGPGALRITLERRRNWFGVLGELDVAGERVELARLLDAVRRHERHVEIDAHSYLEISETLLRHLERLADHVHVERAGLVAGVSSVPSLLALESAGATIEAEVAWEDAAARVKAAQVAHPPDPIGLRTSLRPYQRAGFVWMSRLALYGYGAGGILADDMGLGKTVQAIALLLARGERGPALVLAPTSVAYNWIAEGHRFAPSLRFHLYGEREDRSQALANLRDGDVLVVTYGLLARDLARISSIEFSTAFFDEAQYLKNPKAERTRAARAIRAEVKFALSGTPVENHPGELWSLFSIVFPSLLGRWEAFRRRFALPLDHGLDPRATESLARTIAPFLLRRTKDHVEVELPPRTEIRVPVVLSRDEWQLYEDARLSALSDLESSRAVRREQERRVEVLAALTRLRLLASHPRLYDEHSTVPSSKLGHLLRLLRSILPRGERALVFSQFTAHLGLVREALDREGIPYLYLDGQTPARERIGRVEAFQRGEAPLFLISLKAGGVGLNLTAATHVIHLDPWWNPAVEDQASDRAHRLGQGRPVTIYRLIAVGTIEEQMLALHEHKRALIEQVLRGAAPDATPVSADALLDLLQTSREPPLAASSRSTHGALGSPRRRSFAGNTTGSVHEG